MRSLRSILPFLVIPAVLVLGFRVRHEYWMRQPRDEGARFRALAEKDVQTVSIRDENAPRNDSPRRVTADPVIVRRCLAAAQKAQKRWDASYGNSLIVFKTKGSSRQTILRLNVDTAERDFGPEIAACIADVRRLGAPDF